ncbi:hypothetical protein QFZ64_004128 [Streptomyces sp. B3I8]|nr:hypothetical protein [Streptomyces sp. B3I8]
MDRAAPGPSKMRRMSYGQGEPPWDPWKPGSQQPQWGNQSTSDAPDWAALADASASRNKRRRLLLIVGGAVATVAVGTAVAMAVMSANSGSDDKSAGSLPGSANASGGSASAAEPSFDPTSAPPPLDPLEFISSAAKDKAALSPDTLFPGSQVTLDSRVYTKHARSSTTNCASAVRGTLPKALTSNGCTRVMRVTYTAKGGVAVTVGVAVFDTADDATKARKATDDKSILTSLPGSGVGDFCRTAVCRTTRNSVGRYAYFTLGGFTGAKDVTAKDTKVFTAGDDLAEYTFRQIHRRGETQASAAAVK